MSEWIWFGQAGHFICSYDCRFHLHTHVGNYCVSTVGDWHPRGSEKADTVGVDRLFETMVFPLDDDGETKDWSGLDFRGYNDREAANAGHAEMCHRWAAENLRKKEEAPPVAADDEGRGRVRVVIISAVMSLAAVATILSPWIGRWLADRCLRNPYSSEKSRKNSTERKRARKR